MLRAPRPLWLLPLLLTGCGLPADAPATDPERWFSSPLMPEARQALVSDAAVTVTARPVLTLAPATGSPTVGLVFYPGGYVDPRAYAPAARALARRGYLVAVPSMPLGLAFTGVGAADQVRAAHPEIRAWATAGHSLGGVVAAQVARDQAGKTIQGLVLWASYPAAEVSLAGLPLKVASVYATMDGRARPETVLAAAPRLPASTTWVRIEGGNHAQFGYYGPQTGDGVATLSRDGQLAALVDATAGLLGTL